MKNRLFICIALLLLVETTNAQVIKDTVLVGYTSAPPFIVKNGDNLEGINIWLWNRAAKDLKLNYRLVEMGFAEMLDSLKKGAIDISINPLTITSERNRQMDFTDSFYASNSTIAVAEVSSYQRFVQFLKGFFSANFIKGMMALLFIIFLFGFVGWYFERKKNPDQFRTGGKGIWDGLWWSAVTLTTVGYGDKAPKTGFGKMAALVLMFGGLLFISGLTASIASSLTVNQLNSNPEDFDEFKKRHVGTVKNSSSAGFLKSHFFKNVSLYPSVVDGLGELKQNKLEAFIYDEPILKYRISMDSSLQKVSVLPVKFDVQFYAFGIAKNRPLLERTISQRILEIIETNEWQVVLSEFGLTEL